MTNNEAALLKTIGFSEIGRDLLAHSDNGYNVLYGGGLFESYIDHPRKVISVNGITSTAAGKYQILAHIFDYYKASLQLPDFSPTSQDKIALQLIKEVKADILINDGQFQEAIKRCSTRWASLPGSLYRQHTNNMTYLEAYFENMGGTLS